MIELLVSWFFISFILFSVERHTKRETLKNSSFNRITKTHPSNLL